LKAAGLPVVGISPTLMQFNVNETSALIELALSLGATEIQLVQICKVGRGAELDELTVEQILAVRRLVAQKSRECGTRIKVSGSEGIWENKPFRTCVLRGTTFPAIMGCGAGRTCLALGPNGKARACLLYQKPIGDLSVNSFDELWRLAPPPEMLRLREVKDGCDACDYAPVCSGPCPMEHAAPPDVRRCFVETAKGKETYADHASRKC